MVEYDALTDEQQRAVDALERNVTLTAGAGTGKTTTLTARYVRMLERAFDDTPAEHLDPDEPPLHPEEILTTTFTERAANDLAESILGEITDRIDTIDQGTFAAWRTIADELDQGYIHTLHGFCARLLREHALSVEGVDPGFDTLDEDDADALIYEAVQTVLEEYETHETTETLARRFSRSQLQNVLTDLLAERPESRIWADRWADASADEYLDFVETALHPIDRDEAAERLADPDFRAALTTLQDLIDSPPDIDTGGNAWSVSESVVASVDDGFGDGVPTREKQAMLAALARALTTGGERYAEQYYTTATSNWGDHPRRVAFDDAMKTIYEQIRPEEITTGVEIDREHERHSFRFVQALARLTLIVAEEYEERKARQNALDFTDLITRAVEFLAADEHETLRAELSEQFAYIMVDEFQDTDPRQWDLIKLLTTGTMGSFDADNVFVVGDVKQSIYRFRNADVTQFQEITATLERTTPDADGNRDDQLSTNFRTLPTVLECINGLFDAVFEAGGEAYEAAPQRLSPYRDDPDSLGSVEYLLTPTDPDLRAHRFEHWADFATTEPEHDAELEAMALAARLSQLLADPVQVYPEPDEDTRDDDADGVDEEGSTPRDVEPSDIAILIRSRTHLKEYEGALEEASVPYSVASGLGFYDTPEITALLNLFRALATPTDERALYATLRSPLFGLTDDTLARLKTGEKSLWEALGTSSHDPLQEAHRLLTEWRALAGVSVDSPAGVDGSWAAFLTRIIADTGYLVSVSAGERAQQAVANVEKFREHLRGYSEDDVRSLTVLVNRIERRLDRGGRESEAETTDEGVQILTIHDAKGMEFPVVVVPGIGRQFRDEAAIGNGMVEFEEVSGNHAVGMQTPQPDDPFNRSDTIARYTLREQRRAEERAEEKRVLYVACTRARDHLLLSGLHDSAGEVDEPTLTDLEPPDEDDPSSRRDWVQPRLLTESVCDALDTTNHTERATDIGTYTVSLPTPPADVEAPTPDADPTVELSPKPAAPELSFRLSATDFAALRGGYATLVLDADSRTASIDKQDGESPDERHGDEDAGAPTGEPKQTESEPESPGDAVNAVGPRIFGEMVHRICELRPPQEQWSSVMEQTLADEDADVDLSSELQTRVAQHARRGIDYIQSTAADNVEYRFDELYVTAEFERGEISGYIDHLIVTPERYHIIDYKTGDVTEEEMETDAAYYKKQMQAYAVALNQQDTERSVHVSLYFTDLGQAWETEWTEPELDSLQDAISTSFETKMTDLESSLE